MKKLIILVSFILLTACSGQNEKEPLTEEIKSNTQGNEESIAEDNVIIGIPQDFDSLDPHKAVATGTQEVMFNIFTGLVNIEPDGQIIPELSESYESTEDLTTYTFKLKQNIVFHNGEEMTAKDVLYSYNRILGKTDDQQEPLNAELVKIVDNIEAPDDYTIVFNLLEADAGFLSKCMHAVIPENSGSLQERTPIGAGPFSFVSYTQGIGLKMRKNDNFYLEDMPKLAGIEFRMFTDTNAGQLALKNGEIDIMVGMTENDARVVDDNLNLIRVPQNMVQLLALNNNFEPFKDIRVRQAINYATDKKQIIDALSPESKRIDTAFSPVMEFYYNKDVEDYYPRDVEKAKLLLNEAGYEELSFIVKVPSEYKFHVDTASILKQQLQEAGINMEIEIIDWNTWLDEVNTQRIFEATVVAFTGKIDPSAVLGRYETTFSKNFINFSNSEYDRLIKAAELSNSEEERAELYKQAQMILTQDAASVFIMDPSNIIAINKNLEGYKTYPIGYIDMKNVYYSNFR